MKPGAPHEAGGIKPAAFQQPTAQRLRAVLDYLLLSPAFLSLLYLPQFYYPYTVPKALAFRSIGILVLAVICQLVMSRSALHYDRLKQKLTWIPAALLVVMYATSLFGLSFYHSFWSTFERGDGLLTATAAVIFFYGMLLHADDRFARRIGIASMWVGNLIAVVACFQWLTTHGRVGSTLGNAAFMASYLGMTFFLNLWLARERAGYWRFLAWLGAGLQLFAIVVASSTRGTMVGLAIAGILAALFAAFRLEGRARLAGRVSLVGGAALLVLLLAFRTQLAHVPFLPLQRIATAASASETGATRVRMWGMLGHEALRRPLAGIGGEHVDAVYNTVYRPFAAAEWVDRSHNAYLDYFVQFGIAGALLYLALVAAALRATFNLFRAGNGAGGFLLLSCVTYAAQNLFVFDTALTLWLFLAMLVSTLAMAKSVPRALQIPDIPVAIRFLPGLFALVLLIPVTVQPARADLLLMKANVSSLEDVSRSVRARQEGLALNTYGDLEFGYDAYDTYVAGQSTRLQGEARRVAFQSTVDLLTRNFGRYSYDARTAACLAHLLDLTPPEAVPDAALLQQAIARAMRLSPGRVELPYFRANIEIRKGDAAGPGSEMNARYADAIAVLREYLAAQPDRADPRYVIAGLYLTMGDQAQADKWSSEGDAAFAIHPDIFSAQKAARYYIKASKWSKATRFLQFVLDTDPKEYNAMFTMAKTRFLAGDKAGALALIGQLRAAAPALLAEDPGFVALVEGKRD